MEMHSRSISPRRSKEKTRRYTSKLSVSSISDPYEVQSPKFRKLPEKLKIIKGLTPRIDKSSVGEVLETEVLVRQFRYLTPIKETLNKTSQYPIRVVKRESKSSMNNFNYNEFRDQYDIINKTKLSLLEPFMSHNEVQYFSASIPQFNLSSVIPKPIKLRMVQHSKPTKSLPKHIKTISFKEAMKDKKWRQRARQLIHNDFIEMINRNNGVKMLAPPDLYSYKFYLGNGNNSRLIKQVLSSRGHWIRVREEEKDSAHLVWTQNNSYEDECAEESVSHEIESMKFTVAPMAQFIGQSFDRKRVDLSSLGYNSIYSSDCFTLVKQMRKLQCQSLRIYNKIQGNYQISSKKYLFLNLKRFYEDKGLNVFDVVPLTFHLEKGENDPALEEFENAYIENTLWIVKPGENSNRGNGIAICSSLEDVKTCLSSNPLPRTGDHTFIIQKYIENPLLIGSRKFDIRCFVLLTCYNDIVQAYFYKDGYLRTASKYFTLTDTNKFIHLTNDAVQKQSPEYGRYEPGNKLTYDDLHKFLNGRANFYTHILPEIRNIVKDSVLATQDKLKRSLSFEILGYDFLIDSNLKVWLIEVNSNPCLEVNSPILARIIPAMIENSFKIAVDPMFHTPEKFVKRQNEFAFENKFELIFHSLAQN